MVVDTMRDVEVVLDVLLSLLLNFLLIMLIEKKPSFGNIFKPLPVVESELSASVDFV
jgi:hypothetical protein